MLDYIVSNTNIVEFLTLYDLSQLRRTCVFLKDCIEKQTFPSSCTWVQKCRFYDPTLLWEIDAKHDASCYKPDKKKWTIIYWKKKLPSVVPPLFWNCFVSLMKGCVTMSKFEQWCRFEPKPLVFPCNRMRWEIRMRVDIVGLFLHDNSVYPSEFRNIDEFISVGVSISRANQVHECILGLNAFSIGWHSDDGSIYMDSLLVAQGVPFGTGDKVEVVVDYSNGILMFEKNTVMVYTHELSGDFLCNPLLFSVGCKTMNSLFLTIL